MASICSISKEVYMPSPGPNVAAHAHRHYIGRGVRMVEVRSQTSTSDWGNTIRRRYSENNGATWSDWELVWKEYPTQGELVREESEQDNRYDPASGKVIQTRFQRLVRGDPTKTGLFADGKRLFWDHVFYQLSDDDGRTWDAPRMLRFEAGGDFCEDRWDDDDYLVHNEMYYNGIEVLPNGSVLVSVTAAVEHRDPEDEKVKESFPNATQPGCVGGLLNFIGHWNAARGDYDWQTSDIAWVPRRVSTRGLVETAVSQLTNGDLLLIARGSNAGADPVECPSRKWMTVSEDGGLTWAPVTDLRYDTGEQFYSPCSMPATIRSTKTGRLYFVGNVTETPPEGNGPRYPLVIAEIDEDIPALKKDTLTIIDDRDPATEAATMGMWGKPFENRETLDLELFLTRHWTHADPEERWTADGYRYVLTF